MFTLKTAALLLLLDATVTLCCEAACEHEIADVDDSDLKFHVDASTIKNKCLTGYQGWFGAKGDAQPGYNWRHWTIDPDDAPAIGNVQFDLFPDLSEYPKDSLYDTNLKYKDGSAVRLYSTSHPGVVDLHFQWMRQYGLDGVLLQRFLGEVSMEGRPWAKQKNAVMEQVRSAAEKHGRVFGVTFDVTGTSNEDWADMIKRDWNHHVRPMTSSPAYLHEGGKPVVCVFGLAFHGQSPDPPAADAVALIDWLKDRGAYVIGSGPYWWRTGTNDAGPAAAQIYRAFDAVMPWSVGRYDSPASFRRVDRSRSDAADCAARGQGYAPIAFPGYSFHNSEPGQKPFNEIPRMKGGEFFKAQLDAYRAVDGATFYYVAMFDEVNEGTAIYKAAANKTSIPAGVDFVTMDQDGDSLPSDFYLRTLGDFAESLVEERRRAAATACDEN